MTATSTITHVWHKTEAQLGTNTEGAWERYPVVKQTAKSIFVQRVAEGEEDTEPLWRQSEAVRLNKAEMIRDGLAWSDKTRSIYHREPQLRRDIVWRSTAMGYIADWETTHEHRRQQRAQREHDPSYLAERIAGIERGLIDLVLGAMIVPDGDWWLRNQLAELTRLRAKLKEVGMRK